MNFRNAVQSSEKKAHICLKKKKRSRERGETQENA